MIFNGRFRSLMDTTADLGGKLPRLDSNQQPFGKQSPSAPDRAQPRDQGTDSVQSAPDRTQPHPFTDTKLTRDHGPETITEPDEVFDYYGEPCGIWGQGVLMEGEEREPVPAVYATRDDVQVGDYRLSLDDAERYAVRILTAVAYQREQKPAVPLSVALSPYTAKTDARRAAKAVDR